MRTERDTLFELFEPPPGGVERMRARLAEPAQPRVAFGVAAFGVASLAVLAVLVTLVRTEPPALPAPRTVDDAILAAPELDRLLGRESAPVPLTVERGDQPLQVEELPSSDPQVRIYRVL